MISDIQAATCARFGVEPFDLEPGSMVGLGSLGGLPLNGLRHPPVGQSNGWFIWTGELSSDPDFFRPYHVEHLEARAPLAIRFLALPPGWRFLLAPGHEDAWRDDELLDA